jgi:hypothetical protein
MVTIDDAIPFQIHIGIDVEVSLVSMYVFLTLQIPISGMTMASPI